MDAETVRAARRRRTAALGVPLALVAGLTVACASGPSSAPGATSSPTTQGSDASSAPSRTDEGDPARGTSVDDDTPTSWGPTVGEVTRARRLVAGWDDAALAGQVIVARYHGTAPADAAELVRRLHLAGVSMTTDNIVDRSQVRATTRAVERAVREDGRDFPAVIGVDQEGGTVAHLQGVATDLPSFSNAGARIEAGARSGERVVRATTRWTGLELRSLGFTWVFAPDADVTIGPADVTIGTRSPSSDPDVAAQAVAAAVSGFDASGVVSTIKHFPGHGAVTADSHLVMPVQRASLARLRSRDLRPFVAGVDAGAPAVMMSHIDVEAIAPGRPASLAPAAYRFLREDLGFEGVAITDSLGMGAVTSRGVPVTKALRAGADLLLMPVDADTAVQTVQRALESGRLDRARVRDAAAKVVAMQWWQQRTAQRVAVPADVRSRAERAAQRLAGY